MNHIKHTRYVLIVTLLLLISPVNILSESCCIGDRGNVDYIGEVNVADLTFFVDYLFKSGPAPPCLDEADVIVDENLFVSDLVFLVDYLFKAGPAPGECPPDVIPDVLINLNIPTWFVTDVVEYNTSGAIIDEYETITTIYADTLIGDSVWMVLDDVSSSNNAYAVNRSDGVWYWSDTLSPPEALALKYPATAGQSYPFYEATITVVSTSASVTVPAGTFSCYYYEANVPIIGTIAKFWVAPNIGIIQAEEYGINIIFPYLKTRTKLVSYYLAPY